MRYALLFLSLLFLYSCTTGQELISSGKIQKGLGKQDMRSKFMSSTLSEDPFLPDGFHAFDRNDLKLDLD